MPRKTISMSLGGSSIRAALKELASYQAWVRQKTSELTERLASIGAYEATVRFSRAQYDGEKQAEVSVEPIKNGWARISKLDWRAGSQPDEIFRYSPS